ncbi:regulatory protein GntR HTH [Mycolicibacterium rhodesiae JS60]|nr:regulatory protein GntR HTH [Mycolicibacterium rhodesiae JS60]
MSLSAEAGEGPSGRAATVIADQIRRRIVRGELTEGDLLPSEQQLLVEFGVSRPTMREAIRILESESLVNVKRGSRGGIEVAVPRIETAAHYAGLVLEYRQATTSDVFLAAAAIEAPCAAMLARSRTAKDIRRLKDAVAAERAARDDPERLLQLQNDFHRLVVELVGNDTLRVLSDVVRQIIEVATRRYLVSPALRAEDRIPASDAGIRAHEKLVVHIEAKDAAKAEALWRRQIIATGEQLRRSGVADKVIDLLE